MNAFVYVFFYNHNLSSRENTSKIKIKYVKVVKHSKEHNFSLIIYKVSLLTPLK